MRENINPHFRASDYRYQKHYVYWIHKEEHNDPLNEGYIGVSIDPSRRLYHHKHESNIGTHCNPILQSVFKKYDSSLKLDIIFEGSFEECYKFEEKYRSKENTGWNINQGGRKFPDSVFQNNKGKKRPRHSAIMKEMVASGKLKMPRFYGDDHPLRKKGGHSEETKRKISEARKGRKFKK